LRTPGYLIDEMIKEAFNENNWRINWKCISRHV
jgi:hypothetical protein